MIIMEDQDLKLFLGKAIFVLEAYCFLLMGILGSVDMMINAGVKSNINLVDFPIV